jgi:hypothetical protein
MTAIVSTYVSGLGFAVGADGLRLDAGKGTTVTENARKVFFIEGAGIRLIYAWAGMSSLIFGHDQEFSFLDETALIGNAIAAHKPESIDSYTQQFGLEMQRRLRTFCLPGGRLSNNPNALPREEIAHVLLVGYYNGKPYRTGIRFLQKNLQLQAPFMDELIESPDNFDIFSGSDVILKQFEPIAAPESLQEAAELIRRYIQTCAENRCNYGDCATIGGRVHVATVTPKRFEWAIPPD